MIHDFPTSLASGVDLLGPALRLNLEHLGVVVQLWVIDKFLQAPTFGFIRAVWDFVAAIFRV